MDLLADSREVIRNDVSICLWHWMFCEAVCKVNFNTVGSVYSICVTFIFHGHKCAVHNGVSRISVFIPNRVCCCFSSSPKAMLPFRKSWRLKMLSSVSSISSQRRAAVTEVKGVSAAVWGNEACLPVEVNLLCAGIVVEDCLLLLLNLLKNNSSNQNFFKEGSYIQRMKPWFEVGDDNSGWSAQKVTNLHLMLQVKQNACVCRPLGLNFGFKSRFCFTGRSSVLSVGTSHGVSSEFPRSYGQLSEVYVSVWSAAAALHHPHGHWSACWHPHWGNRSSTSVAVDCKRSHEAVDPDPTNVFRPSTLYRRSSEAHRSTRTTLLLSTLPRIRRGKAGRDPRDIKHSASIWCLISACP